MLGSAKTGLSLARTRTFVFSMHTPRERQHMSGQLDGKEIVLTSIFQQQFRAHCLTHESPRLSRRALLKCVRL